MRVLLIKPETVGIFGYTNLVDHEPLELEYLYTVLREEGHDPRIYDRRHEHTPLTAMLRRCRPQLVCLTAYLTQEALVRRLVRLIKGFDPGIAVVVGGSHVELNYANLFDSEADYLYHVSGLEGFRRLVRYLDTGEGDLSAIPGICYRQGGAWQVTEKTAQNPNDLPYPDRSYARAHAARYRYLTFRPLALVKNAYSCAHSCNFCYCTNLNGGRYACKEVERLVDEIAAVDAPNIHITDDNFLTDARYLTRFAALVRERGIQKRYLIYGRAEFIAHNRPVMEQLADIGLALVMVGLEATTDSALDAYDKQTTAAENEACVRTLHALGIICAGLFIVHQDMTRADFNALYDWICAREIIPTVSIFTPMQGARGFAEYAGRLLTHAPEKQDLFHCILPPAHMSLRRFYYEYYKLSLLLFWNKRRAPLYRCINVSTLLYPLGVLPVKLRRRLMA